MPNEANYNLDYRPASYWNVPEAVYANIKGEFRREQIRQAREAGDLNDIPEAILNDTLSGALRDIAGRINPAFMGGEFLPDYQPEEVEIARITLASVLCDVTSVRARWEDGQIKYSVVDEYDMVFAIFPEASEKPLTLAELIGLIDGAEINGEFFGLVAAHRDGHLEVGGDPKSLVDFVTVTSEFYPQLNDYYLEEAQEWLQEALSNAE